VPETAYAETLTADGDKGTVRLERTERGVRVVLQPRETAVVIGF
jgi:lipopolysaccharide export system protein LptA